MPLPHRFSRALLSGILLSGALLLAVPAAAQVLPHREPPEGELRLGQRVLVDDGSCPAGQIKQVSGARLTPTGVTRVRTCIPRKGAR
jgi:hypothetical protein